MKKWEVKYVKGKVEGVTTVNADTYTTAVLEFLIHNGDSIITDLSEVTG